MTQDTLKEKVIDACRTIYDPEIPVNVYDLGLIYDVSITDTHAAIKMSLTSPACPVAGEMPEWVGAAAGQVDGIDSVNVELVWDPQWGIDMMTDEARLELGLI